VNESACYAGDLSGHFEEALWLPVDFITRQLDAATDAEKP
jgi:hypothetical protein